jgi:SAM-dependent methyltransferase
MTGAVTAARYDGHADWYDAAFRQFWDHSAGTLARLLGAANPGGPVCVDVGCGTALHHVALRARGHRVVGVDLSADQLRVAASRGHLLLAQADGARLPFADGCAGSVVMTFTHTDIDDFRATVAEAARILRPGGRLVYLGVHPCFVGRFSARTDEFVDHQVRLDPGYGDERLHHGPTGPVRTRVGERSLTLASFLAAFIDQSTLRVTAVEELNSALETWSAQPSDGRIVPWNIAVTARATSPTDQI